MKVMGLVAGLGLGLGAACGGASSGPAGTPTTPVVAADPHAGHDMPAMPSWNLDEMAKGAVAIADLGTYSWKVTATPEAQAFFDQGLRLTYGFNHDEAARSYAKALALDPACAMCAWGAALTMGPNYNVPMLPERAAAAWDALGRAQAAAAKVTPVEQALIAALARRYKGPSWIDPVAMQPYTEAYAAAMQAVAKQFPDDLDVQTLTAEAMMNVNPWKLWTPDGKPVGATVEIVAILDGVLKKNPNHPGANHYYIHAVEASAEPGKAVPSADRLAALMPAAGHTVHMPAHIYQRVGRYADAARANVAAMAVDKTYLAAVKPLGYYPFYLAHNAGFLAFAASMLGRSEESLAAARESATHMPKDIVCGMPGMDFFLGEPLLVMVRFGRWDEILKEAKPEAKYQVLTVLWHHARGMALASTSKVDEAKAELATIQKIAAEMPKDLLADLNAGHEVAAVAAKALEARIAEALKAPDAIALWQEAVKLEDGLAYSEPADWFYPLRHYLGAALLDAGKAKEAEVVFREDLRRNPDNGWAQFGLWQALAAQKQKAAAKVQEASFRRAWKDADFELKRAAF